MCYAILFLKQIDCKLLFKCSYIKKIMHLSNIKVLEVGTINLLIIQIYLFRMRLK